MLYKHLIQYLNECIFTLTESLNWSPQLHACLFYSLSDLQYFDKKKIIEDLEHQ